MSPVRPTFWNIPLGSEVLQYVLGLGVVVLLTWAALRYIKHIRRGRGEIAPARARPAWSMIAARILRFVLLPERLREDRYALITHLALFWGMVILAVGTAVATVDWDFFHLVLGIRLLKGAVYKEFELVLDLAGLALLGGVLLAVFRRYLVRPARLTEPPSARDSRESLLLLGLLLLIAVTGFLVEGLRIAGAALLQTAQTAGGGTGIVLGESDRQAVAAVAVRGWAPAGSLIAVIFQGLPLPAVRSVHFVLWWIHALAAFGFLFAIPFTKAIHIVAGFFQVAVPPSDGLPPPPGEPTAGRPGPVRRLTWRQRLEVLACTACGKCQEACPAHLTGEGFTPKGVVWALHGQFLEEVWPWTGSVFGPDGQGVLPKEEAFWRCYTCRACEERCPLLIRHTGLVVDWRRGLVEQGSLAEGLQEVLVNLQRYGNSFGQSSRKRAEWTKGLAFPVKNAAQEPVEYLWFVGDYASFDPRLRPVTQTLARILQLAGLDFGILYEKERNTGNDVRRVGEEGLFEYLREENLRLLERAQWRRIVTADPHSYHALRNEYGLKARPVPAGTVADGGETVLQPSATPSPSRSDEETQLVTADPGDESGNGPVLHSSELLCELLRSGRLRVARSLGRRVTYHDPCYLGRYNGVYEAPRAVLRQIGCEIVEMPRHGRESFCCGAGGGRIWMKDRPGAEERPAEVRVREALALAGVEELVVACPKDFVMFQDAVKSVGAEARLKVVDLATLVWEAVAPDPVASG